MFLLGPLVAYITGVWLVTMSTLDTGLAIVGLPGPCAFGFCNNIISYYPQSDGHVNSVSAAEYLDLHTASLSNTVSIPLATANAMPIYASIDSTPAHTTPETPRPPMPQQFIHIPDFTPVVRRTVRTINPPPTPQAVFQHIGMTNKLPKLKIHTGPKKASFEGSMGNYIILIANSLTSQVGMLPILAGLVIFAAIIPFKGRFRRTHAAHQSRESSHHSEPSSRHSRRANSEGNLRDDNIHMRALRHAFSSCFPSLLKRFLNLIIKFSKQFSELLYPLTWMLCDFIATRVVHHQTSREHRRTDASIVLENSRLVDKGGKEYIVLILQAMTLFIHALLLHYGPNLKALRSPHRWLHPVVSSQARPKPISRFDAVISGNDVHIEKLELATVDSGNISLLPATFERNMQLQLELMEKAFSAEKCKNELLELEGKRKASETIGIRHAHNKAIEILKAELEEARIQARHHFILYDTVNKRDARMPKQIKKLEKANASVQSELNLALSSKRVLTNMLRATGEKLEISEGQEKRTEALNSSLQTELALALSSKQVLTNMLQAASEELEKSHGREKHIETSHGLVQKKLKDVTSSRKLLESTLRISDEKLEMSEWRQKRTESMRRNTAVAYRDLASMHMHCHKQRKSAVAGLELRVTHLEIENNELRVALEQAKADRKGEDQQVVRDSDAAEIDENSVVGEASQRSPSVHCHIPSAEAPSAEPQPLAEGASDGSKLPFLSPAHDALVRPSADNVSDAIKSSGSAQDLDVPEQNPEVESEKPAKSNIFEGKIFDTSCLRFPSQEDYAALRLTCPIFTVPLIPSAPDAGADDTPAVRVAEEAGLQPPQENLPSLPESDDKQILLPLPDSNIEASAWALAAEDEALPAEESAPAVEHAHEGHAPSSAPEVAANSPVAKDVAFPVDASAPITGNEIPATAPVSENEALPNEDSAQAVGNEASGSALAIGNEAFQSEENAPSANYMPPPDQGSAPSESEYDTDDALLDYRAICDLGDGLDGHFGGTDIDVDDAARQGINTASSGEPNGEDDAPMVDDFPDEQSYDQAFFNGCPEADMGDFESNEGDDTVMRQAEDEYQPSNFTGADDAEMGDCETNEQPSDFVAGDDADMADSQVIDQFFDIAGYCDAEMGDCQASHQPLDYNGHESIEMGGCGLDNTNPAFVRMQDLEGQVPAPNESAEAEMTDGQLNDLDLEILGESSHGDSTPSINEPNYAAAGSSSKTARFDAFFERKFGPGSASALKNDSEDVAMPERNEVEEMLASELGDMPHEKWVELDNALRADAEFEQSFRAGAESEAMPAPVHDDANATFTSFGQPLQESERLSDRAILPGQLAQPAHDSERTTEDAVQNYTDSQQHFTPGMEWGNDPGPVYNEGNGTCLSFGHPHQQSERFDGKASPPALPAQSAHNPEGTIEDARQKEEDFEKPPGTGRQSEKMPTSLHDEGNATIQDLSEPAQESDRLSERSSPPAQPGQFAHESGSTSEDGSEFIMSEEAFNAFMEAFGGESDDGSPVSSPPEEATQTPLVKIPGLFCADAEGDGDSADPNLNELDPLLLANSGPPQSGDSVAGNTALSPSVPQAEEPIDANPIPVYDSVLGYKGDRVATEDRLKARKIKMPVLMGAKGRRTNVTRDKRLAELHAEIARKEAKRLVDNNGAWSSERQAALDAAALRAPALARKKPNHGAPPAPGHPEHGNLSLPDSNAPPQFDERWKTDLPSAGYLLQLSSAQATPASTNPADDEEESSEEE